MGYVAEKMYEAFVCGDYAAKPWLKLTPQEREPWYKAWEAAKASLVKSRTIRDIHAEWDERER